jgi:oligosaccharide reducing-end xylanase
MVALTVLATGMPTVAGATQAAAPAASTPPPGTIDTGHKDKPLGPIKRFPGDGSGAVKTGQYRNLFAEQLGVSEAQTKAKIDAVFNQLF